MADYSRVVGASTSARSRPYRFRIEAHLERYIIGLSAYGGGFLIIPMLTCTDTQAEIAFCKQAFGAALLSERRWTDGRIIHATLAVGQSLFMVHGEIAHLASQEPKHDGSSSVVLYLYLSDPDKAIEDAVRAGATVLLPAKDEPWGDRVGRILDPAGHVWNIARSAAARP